MNVYIDNSALRAINYNLSHPAIATLEKAVTKGNIEVLSNSIWEGEFIKHCELVLNIEKDAIHKISCLKEALQAELEIVAGKIQKVTAQSIVESFKTKLKCKVIDTEVDWRIVFQKYFKGDSPFSAKKKDEFPDAFVTEMLKEYLDKNLVVISGDNDFYEWAKNKKGVQVFRSIKDFVDNYIRIQNDEATKLYLSRQNEVEAQVKDHFINYFSDNHYYDITSYHSEIEWASVKGIREITGKILAVNLEESEIEVEFVARGTVELDISAAVVVYDSVDKEDVHLGSNSRSADIDAEFRGKARISVDAKKDLVEIAEIYDEDVFSDDFEIPHEWESFLDE
jgi:hypothetical protein